MYITQLNMEQFNRCNYENFQNIGTLHRNFAYMDPFGIMRIIRILRMLGILKCAADLKVRTIGIMRIVGIIGIFGIFKWYRLTYH